MPRHLEYLNDLLIDVAAGETRRLIVSMPPRSGKSELISRYFPAWFLGAHPQKRVLLASYEATFAATWGRKARDLLEEHGAAIFDGVAVSQDSRAADHWNLEGTDGGMDTAGARGPLTGKGADLFIIDDPIKGDEEANSENSRESLWNWFASVAYPRLEPGGSIVIVMTRWHEDDLVGRIMRERRKLRGWKVVNLPALALERDPLGRAPGEPLWSERFGKKALKDIRDSIGPYWWQALYMGAPAPAEGAVFKRDWIRRWERGEETGQYVAGGEVARYEDLYRFCTVDFASSLSGRADYTAIGTFGLTPGGNLLLLDMVRRRMEGPEIIEAIHAARARHKLHAIWAETTTLNMQTAFVQVMRKDGLPIRAFKADKKKELRALGTQAFCEGGSLYFPNEADWLAEFEREWLSFPHAAHDDMCFVAGTKIQTPVGERPIEELRPGDAVCDRHGRPAVICAAGMTDPNAIVSIVALSDGTRLCGTEGHPVWVLGHGWKPLGQLRLGERVCAWPGRKPRDRRVSGTRASSSGGILTRSAWRIVAITGRMVAMFGTAFSIFIRRCGRTRTALYQPDASFTTAMETSPTTTSRIWSVFRSARILRSIAERVTWPIQIVRRLTSVEFGTLPQHGIGRQRDGLGIGSMPSWSWAMSRLAPMSARAAAGHSNIRCEPIEAADSATTPAGNASGDGAESIVSRRSVSAAVERSPRSDPIGPHTALVVVGLERLPKREPVYNISVDGAHEYYANGVLVHNCDAVVMAVTAAQQNRVRAVAPPDEDDPTDTWGAMWRRALGQYGKPDKGRIVCS